MAVIEFIRGPRDTLDNLEKYKEELAWFKKRHQNILDLDPDTLSPSTRSLTKRRPKKEPFVLRDIYEEKLKDKRVENAGRVKCRYLMELYAMRAAGQKIPIQHPKELDYVR